MFYIDKRIRRFYREGHIIVNRFLKTAWSKESGKYIDCTYSSFKSDRKMEKLLHKEQRGFCCYCMRHLEVSTHTSLEHIMPHNCTNKKGKKDCDKITYYQRFNKIFQHRVRYCHLNQSTLRRRIGPPYPHFCAYENLVLSCDGSLFTQEEQARNLYASKIHYCCNEHRGNKTILPLFLLKNVATYIVYNGNGTITFSSEVKSPVLQQDLSTSISALALEHPHLRTIRSIWYDIAQSEMYGPVDVKAAIDNSILRMNILADSGVDATRAGKVNHKLYWALFSEYYWFYNYFKTH